MKVSCQIYPATSGERFIVYRCVIRLHSGLSYFDEAHSCKLFKEKCSAMKAYQSARQYRHTKVDTSIGIQPWFALLLKTFLIGGPLNTVLLNPVQKHL